MPRAKRLHVWYQHRTTVDRERCHKCGAFRRKVLRSGKGLRLHPLFLYGRDGVNWSTRRPECAPPARGAAALIPEEVR